MRDGQVDGIASAPKRDNVAKTEEDDTDRVRPLRTLRPVAERTNQDDEQKTEVKLEEDLEDFGTSAVGEEVESILFAGGCRGDELTTKRCTISDHHRRHGRRATHEEECKVEVGEGSPGEEELNGVVDELNLEDDLAEEALARRPDAEPEHGRMHRREQRTVQPTATLRDELRDLEIGVSTVQDIHAWKQTVVGTSVAAFALLTYWSLCGTINTGHIEGDGERTARPHASW